MSMINQLMYCVCKQPPSDNYIFVITKHFDEVLFIM